VGDEARRDVRKRDHEIGAECPTCGQAVEPEGNRSFPFCSPRCRMADLGKWMNEDYRISREMKETDLDELDA
jgi:hypothetical protein